MTTALHIVHPKTLKVYRGSFVIGAIEAYELRDTEIEQMACYLLDHGKVVIHHELEPNLVQKTIEDLSFKIDPHLAGLQYNPRAIHITTTPIGICLPDERPPQAPEDAWKNVSELVNTESGLAALVGDVDEHFVIGGYFEYCVTNFAAQAAKRYRSVSVIPELCAHHTDSDDSDIRAKLATNGVRIITAAEARAMTGMCVSAEATFK